MIRNEYSAAVFAMICCGVACALPATAAPGAAPAPGILELGSEGAKIWAVFESGEGKAAVAEASLLYTLNSEPFDSTGGRREEWFQAPALVGDGQVDANGFLVTSEPRNLCFKDYNE